MFALEPIITTQVEAALGDGWDVFMSTDDGNRTVARPTATVRLVDGAVADSKTGAVNVMPSWAVLLVVRKGATAAARLDEAFSDLVRELHNWAPGQAAGRAWNRLALAQIVPPPLADDGLIGLEVVFNTHACYDGQAM